MTSTGAHKNTILIYQISIDDKSYLHPNDVLQINFIRYDHRCRYMSKDFNMISTFVNIIDRRFDHVFWFKMKIRPFDRNTTRFHSCFSNHVHSRPRFSR